MRVEILRATTIERRAYKPGELVDFPEKIAKALIRTGTAGTPGKPPVPSEGRAGKGNVEHR